jgi:hypothetical protein
LRYRPACLAVDGKKRLFFTTVLDTYEEIEETLPASGIYHREDWMKKARWTLDAADALVNITSTILDEPVLNYLKNYVAITVGGNNYMWAAQANSEQISSRFSDRSVIAGQRCGYSRCWQRRLCSKAKNYPDRRRQRDDRKERRTF